MTRGEKVLFNGFVDYLVERNTATLIEHQKVFDECIYHFKQYIPEKEEQIRKEICEKHIALFPTIPLLHIFNKHTAETKHTYFIAWLFRYYSEHGADNGFLVSFLNTILKKLKVDKERASTINCIETKILPTIENVTYGNDYEVVTDFALYLKVKDKTYIKYGDIVVLHKGEPIIIIENKINHIEDDYSAAFGKPYMQTDFYYDSIKEMRKDNEDFLAVFLSYHREQIPNNNKFYKVGYGLLTESLEDAIRQKPELKPITVLIKMYKESIDRMMEGIENRNEFLRRVYLLSKLDTKKESNKVEDIMRWFTIRELREILNEQNRGGEGGKI